MSTRTASLLFLVCACSLRSAPLEHWAGTWAASPSPQLAEAQLQKEKLEFDHQTLREIVHISIGGDTLRVRLSNAYGNPAVQISAAHIALHGQGSATVPDSDRVLTFGGRSAVSIPPNAPVLSDPVKLQAAAGSELSISLYFAEPTTAAGIHYDARQTSYIGNGDLTAAASMNDAATGTSWAFLTGVDVAAPASAATIVAFGDSITDGARSTIDANHRWPDVLAARLLARHAAREIGVVDAGIGGNRILHDASGNVAFGVNALARFDRDVLSEPGVRYVIVLEGINDIGHAGTSAPASETVSADDIIAGLTQLIARAHEHGLKIFGGTLTPFEGTIYPGYYTPEKEIKRKAVNEWIRTGKAFDGVIDFDKAVRDASSPGRMRPDYDGGDHLHPGDAGYKAMAAAIDLSLFN
ncbi:MAG TPA: SGNH/GDSL hydrolase family protein [Bryobacteraceae bacterium]|nr:SGNH/GDSL hydrolase family protein [Bryobacteraceae bacterium]